MKVMDEEGWKNKNLRMKEDGKVGMTGKSRDMRGRVIISTS
jgi:hypothetical protein